LDKEAATDGLEVSDAIRRESRKLRIHPCKSLKFEFRIPDGEASRADTFYLNAKD
jgi:hypothetical protein